MKLSAPPAQIPTQQIAMRFFGGVSEAPTREQTEDKANPYSREDGWDRVLADVKLSFMKSGGGALFGG